MNIFILIFANLKVTVCIPNKEMNKLSVNKQYNNTRIMVTDLPSEQVAVADQALAWDFSLNTKGEESS